MTSDAKERKATPIYSGVIAYFPDALAAVARVSKAGNDQHNPGSELHWDRSKSKDEYDACTRHLVDRASGAEFDTDGQRHMAKVAWRALAALQKEVENSKTQKIATGEPVLPQNLQYSASRDAVEPSAWVIKDTRGDPVGYVDEAVAVDAAAALRVWTRRESS